MGEVTFTVAGRPHTVACRDGEEPQLRELAAMLDAHSESATRASGGLSAERTMMFIALMLADEVAEARRNPPAGIPDEMLDRIADRLEAVAATLEDESATS
ncbi:cell division protein ZapA [Stakelama saccharophila]|uniref:Cell division protein ZapA n=1 Tax=Stakelama saccharophila TaxID=3075605 RepID=A0ABZ0BCT0_9SPHN|nr:cell division protein ZapA [Stakelama sp. W311]WNO54992.1 cell division protein ZapA [Stakelama sp. W311]